MAWAQIIQGKVPETKIITALDDDALELLAQFAQDYSRNGLLPAAAARALAETQRLAGRE